MKRRVILFGAGNNGKKIKELIDKDKSFFIDDYVAFADNSADKIGTEYCGLPVISAKEIVGKVPDYVVVCPYSADSIVDQLMNEEKVDYWRILTFDEYKRQRYTEERFNNRFQEENKHKKNIFDTKKIVVYTAITGNYDDLKDPEFSDDSITYVCFTNNREYKSNIWNVEYIDDQDMDNYHLAKSFKFFPDKYFKDYETSIWVDAKFLIREDLRSYITEYERNKPILCFPHFSRKCIYDEAIECILAGKAKKEGIIEQISRYYLDGYPFDNGLYEMGCIVRNHNDGFVKKLMSDWNHQINTYTGRDQISFPYICWKNEFLPDISDLYIENNIWLKKREHNKS